MRQRFHFYLRTSEQLMNFRELDSMYCNAFVIILEKKRVRILPWLEFQLA